MKGNCYNPYAARGIAVSCILNCQRRDYIAKIKCCQHMTFSILSKFNKNFVLQTVQRYFNWLIRLLMSLYPSPTKIANVVFHSNSFFFLLLQHMTSFSVIKYVLCSQLILYLRIHLMSFHLSWQYLYNELIQLR